MEAFPGHRGIRNKGKFTDHQIRNTIQLGKCHERNFLAYPISEHVAAKENFPGTS